MRRDMPFGWGTASLTHPHTAFKAEPAACANRKSSQFHGRMTTDAKVGKAFRAWAGTGCRRDLLQFQRTIVNRTGKIAVEEGGFDRFAGDGKGGVFRRR